MYHIPIFLEHIDLFDRLDGLDIELLEGGLQLLVIGAGGLMDFLLLSSRGSLPSALLSVIVFVEIEPLG